MHIKTRESTAMKIESFKLRRGFSETNVEDQLRFGSYLRKAGKLKFLTTLSKDIEIGFQLTPTSLQFYLFDKIESIWVWQNTPYRCFGSVCLEKPSAKNLTELFQKFKRTKFLIPHSTMLTGYRGLGYPSFIYSLYIRKGYCLISEKHTTAAAILWDSVAKKNGIEVLHYEPRTRLFVAAPTPTSLKMLSLKRPT